MKNKHCNRWIKKRNHKKVDLFTKSCRKNDNDFHSEEVKLYPKQYNYYKQIDVLSRMGFKPQIKELPF